MRETFYPYIAIDGRSIIFFGHNRFAMLLLLSLSLDILTDIPTLQVFELCKKVFSSELHQTIMTKTIKDCLTQSELISGPEYIDITPLKENLANTTGITEYRFVYCEGELGAGAVYSDNNRIIFK